MLGHVVYDVDVRRDLLLVAVIEYHSHDDAALFLIDDLPTPQMIGGFDQAITVIQRRDAGYNTP